MRELFHQKQRTLCAKAVVSLFLGLGIVCAMFAICSCRWYMVAQGSYDENHDVFQTYDPDTGLFRPKPSVESTVVGMGLFRYQRETKAIATTTSTNEEYHQCVSYPGIWVGTHHPWKFTSQLCAVLGPIVALVSICLILLGNSTRFWSCTMVLLATGLHMAGMVSSLSWCNSSHSYWHCPWLTGALLNLMACALFFVSWFLALCGLTDDSDDAATTSGAKDGRNSVTAASNTNNDSVEPSIENGNDSSFPSSVCIAKTSSMGESLAVSGMTDRTQADIENAVVALYRDDKIETSLAPNRAKIRTNATNEERDDGSGSVPKHELYYDTSFDHDDDHDDETKSSVERIANSNQIFLDLDVKMKERRDKMQDNSSAGVNAADFARKD
eukprot:jgi/Psemu1/290196/fgenesh1_pg.464_\